MLYHSGVSKTTEQLIADYDAAIAGRWVRCELGSARAASRQRNIDAIVDAISARADSGDADAIAWYGAI